MLILDRRKSVDPPELYNTFPQKERGLFPFNEIHMFLNLTLVPLI
jgi:hypothetical protein